MSCNICALECTCYDTSRLSLYDGRCSCHPTLHDSESLRRRIIELESMLDRKICDRCNEVPNELRIMQAENSHFRDLTYSRLAEVEYWKKMYTTERKNYQDKLESMRREYEEKFEREIQRLRGTTMQTETLEVEYRRNMENKKKEWEAKFAAALKEELNRLRLQHENDLRQVSSNESSKDVENEKLRLRLQQIESEMRRDDGSRVRELEQEIQSIQTYYQEREKLLKTKLASAIEEEAERILSRDMKNMVAMEKEIDSLKTQLKNLLEEREKEDKARLLNSISILKEKASLQDTANSRGDNNSKQLTDLKRENEDLRRQMVLIVNDRDEMYRNMVNKDTQRPAPAPQAPTGVNEKPLKNEVFQSLFNPNTRPQTYKANNQSERENKYKTLSDDQDIKLPLHSKVLSSQILPDTTDHVISITTNQLIGTPKLPEKPQYLQSNITFQDNEYPNNQADRNKPSGHIPFLAKMNDFEKDFHSSYA